MHVVVESVGIRWIECGDRVDTYSLSTALCDINRHKLAATMYSRTSHQFTPAARPKTAEATPAGTKRHQAESGRGKYKTRLAL